MQLTTDIHLLESSKGSYVYLVLGQEPVLIDTGMPGRGHKIVQELAQIGLRPNDIAHILLTHHDVDHIGNAKELKSLSGATLWAPALDIPYIHGEQRRPGIKRIIATLVKHERPEVDQSYAPGQKIGGIEMIETPGHTPGHVSFLYGNALFAGDLVMSRKGQLKPSPGLMTWNTTELNRSINLVKKLTFDWVMPAHGEPVKGRGLFDF